MAEESIDLKIFNSFLDKNKEVSRISTLNHMGGMTRNFDKITKNFINFTVSNKQNSSFRTLEIGAAYGDVALECLKKGVANYLINDLDKRHLEIFKLRAKRENIDHNAVEIISGDFPDVIQFFPFYDAILISRVMHFFEPSKWKRSLNTLFYLLKPGGKIFITVISPYVKPFVPFLKKYLERRKEGEPFPGFIKDIFKELHIPRITELSEDPNNHFPKLNLMCTTLLTSHFRKVGFEVLETCEFPFMYESTIWQLDGRESAGLIATKR